MPIPTLLPVIVNIELFPIFNPTEPPVATFTYVLVELPYKA